MMAAIFLLGAAFLGVALIRRAFAASITHAEQLLWGLVFGWTLTTALTYGLARLSGRLSFGIVLTVLIATWVAAMFLSLPGIKNLAGSRSLPRIWRREYGYLLALLGLFAPIYFALFRSHMLQPGADGGLYSGGKSAPYDMAFHAALTTSFVDGGNFPPVYTPMPPAPLLYPFMADFQSALLVALGMDLHSALVSTGLLLALALTGIFYFFALRLLALSSSGTARQPLTAALATILFLFNGGLGFIYFLRDWRESGKSFLAFCSALETNYANLAEKGILWANIIADGLLPQRTSLFGISLTLIIFALFAIFWRESSVPNPKSNHWRLLLAAGLLAALLPVFHTHSFAAVAIVSIVLCAIRPRRLWLAFWLPAVLLALPQLASLVSHVTGAGFAHFQLGWRGHHDTNWVLFWLRNLGLPTLLIIPAWFQAARTVRLFYLAFLALLAFSLLLVLSPNDYDNLKLMYYWYAATCVLVAGWLVNVAARRRWLVPVGLAVVVSTASGLLAVTYEFQSKSLIFSRDEVAAAAFVRENTAPRSLFLTAPSLHQPILSLAGRAVVRGASAWLWSHGYPFAEREGDVRAIYSGRDDALQLIGYYGVDYVYLSPREREEFKVADDFFQRTFPRVYQKGDISIYDARGSSSNPSRWLAGYPPREYAARVERDPFQPLVEFPDIGYALYRLHKLRHGRPPHYDEFMPDLRAIGGGVYPGSTNWREVLEANLRKLTNAWTEDGDFKARYDALPDDKFVDTLHSNAGIEAAQRERAELCAALASGKESRASVLRRISNAPRFFARDYNAAYVRLHYFGYLQRDPQDDYWLGELDRRRDFRSLTRAFLESGEYKTRGR